MRIFVQGVFIGKASSSVLPAAIGVAYSGDVAFIYEGYINEKSTEFLQCFCSRRFRIVEPME